MRYYYRQRGVMMNDGSIGYYWQVCDSAYAQTDPLHIVADKVSEANVECLTHAMEAKFGSEITLEETS